MGGWLDQGGERGGFGVDYEEETEEEGRIMRDRIGEGSLLGLGLGDFDLTEV